MLKVFEGMQDHQKVWKTSTYVFMRHVSIFSCKRENQKVGGCARLSSPSARSMAAAGANVRRGGGDKSQVRVLDGGERGCHCAQVSASHLFHPGM